VRRAAPARPAANVMPAEEPEDGGGTDAPVLIGLGVVALAVGGAVAWRLRTP
jgi:hypothetical protein